jgi:hypothetical protein
MNGDRAYRLLLSFLFCLMIAFSQHSGRLIVAGVASNLSGKAVVGHAENFGWILPKRTPAGILSVQKRRADSPQDSRETEELSDLVDVGLRSDEVASLHPALCLELRLPCNDPTFQMREIFKNFDKGTKYLRVGRYLGSVKILFVIITPTDSTYYLASSDGSLDISILKRRGQPPIRKADRGRSIAPTSEILQEYLEQRAYWKKFCRDWKTRHGVH